MSLEGQVVPKSPWALFHRKSNTEPKPNRIVGSSVFRFGFGFGSWELRCSVEESVSDLNRTELP